MLKLQERPANALVRRQLKVWERNHRFREYEPGQPSAHCVESGRLVDSGCFGYTCAKLICVCFHVASCNGF